MNVHVQEWLDISREDYDAAEVMFENRKYLYSVFMCQQAVEKAIKRCTNTSLPRSRPVSTTWCDSPTRPAFWANVRMGKRSSSQPSRSST